MPQRKLKNKTEPERRITVKELDKELKTVSFKSKREKFIFDEISKQTWFRQYGRESKSQLAKITKKVKKGIKHGAWSYISDKYDEQIESGKVKPDAAYKKRVTKGQDNATKKLVKELKKVNRKQRQIVKQQERKAPSGRQYSATEIREGVGSKRAVEYRKKHGIKKNDWSY